MSIPVDLVQFRSRCEQWFAERYEVLDPERHDVPGLIAHTADDHDAPMREACRYQRALWEAGLAGVGGGEGFGGEGMAARVGGGVPCVARTKAHPPVVGGGVGVGRG